MKRLLLLYSIIAIALCAAAQSPVKWTATARMTSKTEGTLTVKAAIQPGWHLYGTSIPDGGPKPTTIDLSGSTGMKFIGQLKPTSKPIEKLDDTFGIKLNYWENSAVFTVKFRLTVKDRTKAKAAVNVSFMACNDENCTPPQTVKLTSAVLPKK